MIRQLWQSLTYRPHAAYIRPMGFLYEALALQQHALAKNQPWAAHYAHCRRVIAEFVLSHPQVKSWVILGVGTGEDLPWARLLATLEQITLVDAVILPQTKARWAVRHPNATAQVEWLEMDVTGVLPAVHRHPRETALRSIEAGEWPEMWQGAGVISLNLMMQLAVLPGLWMRRQGVALRQIEAFSRQLIAAHRALLAQVAEQAPVLLITELGETWLSPEGERLLHEDWLQDDALRLAEWDWHYRYVARQRVQIVRHMAALRLG